MEFTRPMTQVGYNRSRPHTRATEFKPPWSNTMRNSSKLSFAAATLAVLLSAGSLEAQAGNDNKGRPPTSDPRPTPTPTTPAPTATATSGSQSGAAATAGANAGAHNTTNVGVGQTTNVPVTVKPTTNVGQTTTVGPTTVGPTSQTTTVSPTQTVGPTTQTTTVGPNTQTVGPTTQNVGPTTQTVGPTTQANTQTVGPTTQTADQRQTTTTTQEVGQTNANQATGNVTSYNSNFKAGAATSMNTAANYVLKQCVASVAVNLFGGGVFGNYGGLGIAITPSGAIAVKDENGDIFLVEDFADATPEERGKMAKNLSDKQVNLVGCLGGEWKRLQAKIQADLQMTQDSNLTLENIEIIRGNTLVRVEQVRQAANLARPGVEHVCYRAVVIGGDGKPVAETLPLRGLGATGKVGHEYCEQVLEELFKQMNDASQPMELRTRPDITAPRSQPRVRAITPPAAAAGTPPAPSGSN
jgi:hypothetical protein